MRPSCKLPPLFVALFGLVLMLGFAGAQKTCAQTLWTGPNTNFTQSASNFTDVLIPGAVSLSRNFSQWLFNPDGGDQGPAPGTPTDTGWAFGTVGNYAALSYQSFDSLRNGDLSALIVSNAMVVHLTNEGIYLSLTFSAWPQHGGFFAYTRSTPAVTITTPTNGTQFAAPANVNIVADAAVAGHTVTNVEFFANTTSLGAVQSAPYSVKTGNLAGGQYALTAVETAGGISETSLVVNISVVTSAVTLSRPRITNNLFAFDYSANAGSTYVVQKSSNLVNWLAVITNTPTNNSVHFTDTFTKNGVRYYRIDTVSKP
jgi:hypothetical protein